MKEPSHTCPTIDKHIKNLQDEISDAFEDVRSANIEIREWGQYWESEASRLEKELDEAKEKIQDLEYELKEARDRE